MYTWSINATDGIVWTNQTFTYTTSQVTKYGGDSRYDVNNDCEINFIDAGLVWLHRTSQAVYDGLYDINRDGEVDFIDAGLIWINRD